MNGTALTVLCLSLAAPGNAEQGHESAKAMAGTLFLESGGRGLVAEAPAVYVEGGRRGLAKPSTEFAPVAAAARNGDVPPPKPGAQLERDYLRTLVTGMSAGTFVGVVAGGIIGAVTGGVSGAAVGGIAGAVAGSIVGGLMGMYVLSRRAR